MYIGPWQELKLSRLIAGHQRVLTEAIQQSIHARIETNPERTTQTRGTHRDHHLHSTTHTAGIVAPAPLSVEEDVKPFNVVDALLSQKPATAAYSSHTTDTTTSHRAELPPVRLSKTQQYQPDSPPERITQLPKQKNEKKNGKHDRAAVIEMHRQQMEKMRKMYSINKTRSNTIGAEPDAESTHENRQDITYNRPRSNALEEQRDAARGVSKSMNTPFASKPLPVNTIRPLTSAGAARQLVHEQRGRAQTMVGAAGPLNDRNLSFLRDMDINTQHVQEFYQLDENPLAAVSTTDIHHTDSNNDSIEESSLAYPEWAEMIRGVSITRPSTYNHSETRLQALSHSQNQLSQTHTANNTASSNIPPSFLPATAASPSLEPSEVPLSQRLAEKQTQLKTLHTQHSLIQRQLPFITQIFTWLPPAASLNPSPTIISTDKKVADCQALRHLLQGLSIETSSVECMELIDYLITLFTEPPPDKSAASLLLRAQTRLCTALAHRHAQLQQAEHKYTQEIQQTIRDKDELQRLMQQATTEQSPAVGAEGTPVLAATSSSYASSLLPPLALHGEEDRAATHASMTPTSLPPAISLLSHNHKQRADLMIGSPYDSSRSTSSFSPSMHLHASTASTTASSVQSSHRPSLSLSTASPSSSSSNGRLNQMSDSTASGVGSPVLTKPSLSLFSKKHQRRPSISSSSSSSSSTHHHHPSSRSTEVDSPGKQHHAKQHTRNRSQQADSPKLPVLQPPSQQQQQQHLQPLSPSERISTPSFNAMQDETDELLNWVQQTDTHREWMS